MLNRFKPDEYPTGIFCANDSMACGVISALRERGLNVPGDVSVVGFDDAQISQLAGINLTTIRQPLRPMGVYAVETLLKAIDEGVGCSTEIKNLPEYKNRESNEFVFNNVRCVGSSKIFPSELVIRDSVSAASNK